MKPSTPAPLPPVSRKLRSDSKLSALPPEAQSLLLRKLETQSYQETASWLHDTHRIIASPSNLSTFRSRHLESQALKEAYLQAATFHCTLQDLKTIDPGDAQMEAAVRRLFLFKVVNQGDIGTYLHFTRVGNESKKLALTQAREARLQQEQQLTHSDSQDPDLLNPTDLSISPLLSPLSALHPNPVPCAPLAQPPIGVGTSRPHTMPQDSNLSHTDHPRPDPNAPSFDSAPHPSKATAPSVSNSPLPPEKPASSDPVPGCDEVSSPADPLEAFQTALDSVMPLDESEPVSPSSLDPFYATIIGTVIGRMLDLIQAGKLPNAASSPAAAAQPTPAPATSVQKSIPASPPVPAVSPMDLEEEKPSTPSSLPLPCNSLKYPKTPSIRRAKIFLPDRPASEPTSLEELKNSIP